jgi:hypothetical protein
MEHTLVFMLHTLVFMLQDDLGVEDDQRIETSPNSPCTHWLDSATMLQKPPQSITEQAHGIPTP